MKHTILTLALILASINISCSGEEVTQKEDEIVATTTEYSKKIVIRCDDIGMSHSVNMALSQIIATGMPVSASIIVPAPWFAEAVTLLQKRPNKVALGIHLCANSEWASLRWRPISGASRVPSLIDELGYFKSEYIGNWEMSADIEELKTEFRAQIQTAIAAGLDITYIDGHMGVETATAEHVRIVRELGKEFNLAVSGSFQEITANFKNPGSANVDLMNSSGQKLGTIDAENPFLLIIHPGLDSEEMRALHLKGSNPSYAVATGRNSETDMLISDAFKKLLQTYELQPINYSQLQ